jgi:hypothetical protein
MSYFIPLNIKKDHDIYRWKSRSSMQVRIRTRSTMQKKIYNREGEKRGNVL